MFRRGKRVTFAPHTLRRGEGRQPRSVIKIANGNHHALHPTQKPLALMAYLIRTYTDPGAVVLDNTMGSGTTGVACVHEGRDFVGIEMGAAYFAIAQERIANAQPPLFVEATA